MNVETVMAQLIVADLTRSADFYRTLFGGATPTSARWRSSTSGTSGTGGAVQVYEEPERAGQSGVTLAVADLDAEVAALDAAGIEHEPLVDATYVRVVQLTDPTRTGSSSSAPSPDGDRRLVTGRRIRR